MFCLKNEAQGTDRKGQTMTTLHQAILLFADLGVKLILFQKISSQRIPMLSFFLFTAGMAGLTLFNPVVFAFFQPISLLLVSFYFLKTKWRLSQHLFFGLLPFVATDLYQRASGISEGKYFVLIVGITDWHLTFLVLTGILSILLLVLLLAKILRLDAQNFTSLFQNQLGRQPLFFINSALLFYGGFLYPLFIFSGEKQKLSITLTSNRSSQTVDLLLLYVFLLLAVLIYLNYKAREYMDLELQRRKDQQLAALSSYSQHVESLYQELRSFRHDYSNILISLNHALQQNDLTAAKQIYESVLKDSDKKFYDSKYDVANLSNLQNDALKSILSAKLFQAQELGFDLTVEIPEPIQQPNIDLLDAVTVLSIFLDNAIEASQQTIPKKLNLAYFSDQEKNIFIIENSTVEEKIQTKTIYDYKQSSKGTNRGIGLATVKDILAKYPHVGLVTSSRNHIFHQEITFHPLFDHSR